MLSRALTGVASVALAVVLVACAADRVGIERVEPAAPEEDPEVERLFGLALDRWIERSSRLQHISQRLRVAGRELCQRRETAVLGAAVQDLSQLPPILRDVSLAHFGSQEGLYVIAVFPEMAAARAGVRPGDRLVRLDGRSTDGLTDLDARWNAAANATDLVLERDGGSLSLRIEPDAGCGYPAALRFSDIVNAFAIESGITVTTSLIREVRDDSLLAMVLGHELGHHILNVRSSNRARIREESHADYLGIYLAAMAGFPLSEDSTLYLTLVRDVNRLAKRNATHPIGPSRALAFRKTLEEIAERKRAGTPLRPDR